MANGPRSQEFSSAEESLQITNADGQPTLKYKKLKLDPKSKTYAQVRQWFDSWKGDPSAKPSFDDLTTLKYTVDASKTSPADVSGVPLYIAMYGGGGPKNTETYAESGASNDEQWYEMTQLYKSAIKKGIYVTTRGVGNSWDLHFTATNYVLMERLIENMILFGNVDANQVYLLGFSAGGDAVYRLAHRLSQRFAAVNAGGGHPGDVGFTNTMNVPVCLQVGERDNSYNRCKTVADAGVVLDELAGAYPGKSHYLHDVFIHPTTPGDYVWVHYSGWEATNRSCPSPDTPRQALPVVKNYTEWRDHYPIQVGTSTLYNINTNAIDWLNSHNARLKMPTNVMWDLSSANDNFGSFVFENTAGRGQDGTGRSQNYWLDINQYTSADVGDVIEARIDSSANTIVVVQAKKYLRILLRPGMLSDLSKPVHVQVGTDSLTVQTTNDNITVIQDTLIRSDPNLVFTTDIILTQNGAGKWSATTTPVGQTHLRA